MPVYIIQLITRFYKHDKRHTTGECMNAKQKYVEENCVIRSSQNQRDIQSPRHTCSHTHTFSYELN